MGSPKHLWSGDWQDESAAARRRGASSTADTAATPGQPRPAADTATPPSSAPRTRTDDLRRVAAAWNRRQWTAAAALMLAVALIAGTAVALLHHDHARPPHTSSASLPRSPLGALRPPSAPQGSPGNGQGSPGAGQVVPGAGLVNPAGSSPGAALAWLGVELQPSATGGAAVEGIVAGGPADAAALRPGDVIVGIDNRPVDSPGDLTNAIGGLKPGETVTVHFRRGGAEYDTPLTLAARPAGYSSP